MDDLNVQIGAQIRQLIGELQIQVIAARLRVQELEAAAAKPPADAQTVKPEPFPKSVPKSATG
jgi:hypothetical protein